MLPPKFPLGANDSSSANRPVCWPRSQTRRAGMAPSSTSRTASTCHRSVTGGVASTSSRLVV